MDKVEGIELSEEFSVVNEEILADKKLIIRKKIAHIIGDRNLAIGSIRDLENKLAKAKQALERNHKLIEGISAGDWSSIQFDKNDIRKEEPCQ